MSNESEESRGASGAFPSLRARIAHYREQAAHFARLAETEPVERIRDKWKDLARDYAYLANTLESDLSHRQEMPDARWGGFHSIISDGLLHFTHACPGQLGPWPSRLP
jgi:hypothetical protein